MGGDWGPVDEGAAAAVVRRALDLGITCFDTARAYGWGRAEAVLGRALRSELRSRRESVVLATKVGLRRDSDAIRRDGRPGRVRAAAYASLRELGVDYVDVLYLHWPDPTRSLEAIADELRLLVELGAAGAIGVSNLDVGELERFARHCPIAVVQPPLSAVRREALETVIPWCATRRIEVVVYSPLAHGLLARPLPPTPTNLSPDDWRATHDAFSGEAGAAAVQAAGALSTVAAAHDRSLAQLALQWVLAQPGVSGAIVGARRPAQLDELTSAAEDALPVDLRAAVDALVRDVRFGGPAPAAA